MGRVYYYLFCGAFLMTSFPAEKSVCRIFRRTINQEWCHERTEPEVEGTVRCFILLAAEIPIGIYEKLSTILPIPMMGVEGFHFIQSFTFAIAISTQQTTINGYICNTDAIIQKIYGEEMGAFGTHLKLLELTVLLTIVGCAIYPMVADLYKKAKWLYDMLKQVQEQHPQKINIPEAGTTQNNEMPGEAQPDDLQEPNDLQEQQPNQVVAIADIHWSINEVEVHH